MRWDDLFRDLEAQLERRRGGRAGRRGRRPHPPRGRASWRWWTGPGRRWATRSLRVLGAGPVDGLLADVGTRWLLVAETSGRQALVPLSGVLSLAGLRAWTVSAR